MTEEYSSFRFNTALAALMECNNVMIKQQHEPVARSVAFRDTLESMMQLLAPLAPHAAEELWSRLGHPGSLAYTGFPVADPDLLVEESVTCVVQVAGKVRERLQVPPSVTDDELRALALASDAVAKALDGRAVRTVVVRAPRLVNVVPA